MDAADTAVYCWECLGSPSTVRLSDCQNTVVVLRHRHGPCRTGNAMHPPWTVRSSRSEDGTVEDDRWKCLERGTDSCRHGPSRGWLVLLRRWHACNQLDLPMYVLNDPLSKQCLAISFCRLGKHAVMNCHVPCVIATRTDLDTSYTTHVLAMNVASHDAVLGSQHVA